MNGSEFGNVTNASSNFLCPFEETNLSRNLKVFAIFFVGGFGILNNVFIIVLALKYTTRKNLHHLIINMAVADALVVVLYSGFKMPSMIDRNVWADIEKFSGDIICKILPFFALSSVFVSYTSLAIIVIERFRASRRTMQITRPYTVRQRLATVASSWFVSLVLGGVYEAPYRSIEKRFDGAFACTNIFKVPNSLNVFVQTTLGTGLFLIFILSAVTLRRLSRRQEIDGSLSEVQKKAKAKRITGAIKMVLFSLLLYAFCYLPPLIWESIKGFSEGTIDINLLHCYDMYIFDFLVLFLPLLNCCLGPCIYLTFLTDFRQATKRLVCRRIINAVET